MCLRFEFETSVTELNFLKSIQNYILKFYILFLHGISLEIMHLQDDVTKN